MWSEVSYRLFTNSGQKYVRHPHVCRERWQNHLNAHINKGEWTPEEDL